MYMHVFIYTYIYLFIYLFICIYIMCIYIYIELEVSCCFSVNLQCLISVGSLVQANLTDSEVREWTCLTIYLSPKSVEENYRRKMQKTFSIHIKGSFFKKQPVVHP